MAHRFYFLSPADGYAQQVTSRFLSSLTTYSWIPMSVMGITANCHTSWFLSHNVCLISSSTSLGSSPNVRNTHRIVKHYATNPSNLSINRFHDPNVVGSYVLRKRFSLVHHILVCRAAGNDGPSPSQYWLRRSLPNQPLQQHPVVSTSQAASKGNAE